MAWLAQGAGAGLGTVLLLNLRGDLGDPDAGRCSDVAVPGARWILGHSETAPPAGDRGPRCPRGAVLAADELCVVPPSGEAARIGLEALLD